MHAIFSFVCLLALVPQPASAARRLVPLKYPAIASALAASLAGNAGDVAAGPDARNIIVSVSLTLLGPNAGVDPNAAARVPEAVIVPEVNATVSGQVPALCASGITIDGLTTDGASAPARSGSLSHGQPDRQPTVHGELGNGRLYPVQRITREEVQKCGRS